MDLFHDILATYFGRLQQNFPTSEYTMHHVFPEPGQHQHLSHPHVAGASKRPKFPAPGGAQSQMSTSHLLPLL